jgi:hypothetical protein
MVNSNNNYRDKTPKDKCSLCDITAEQTSSKFIEIDHKDKDRSNNEISNLWALCKFCHSIKSKYENQMEEQVFWSIAIGTLEPYTESVQTFKENGDLYLVTMTIKEFLHKASFDYFKGKEKLKEHFVVRNVFAAALDEIQIKYRKQINEKLMNYSKARMRNESVSPDDVGDWYQ